MQSITTYNPIPEINYQFLEHTWSYFGKINILLRQLLSAAAASPSITDLMGSNFPDLVKHLTTRMKLFAIVSVPFSFGDISACADRIINRIQLDQKMDAAIELLTFTVISADIVDSSTTFVNAALTVYGYATVEIFSRMGFPLALTMSGLGTITRSYKIVQNLNRQEELRQKPITNDTEASIEKIQRDINLDLIRVAANIVNIAALILFAMGAATIGIPAPVPYLFLAAAFSLRITAVAFQDYYKNQR
jgi:hypothetical protein